MLVGEQVWKAAKDFDGKERNNWNFATILAVGYECELNKN